MDGCPCGFVTYELRVASYKLRVENLTVLIYELWVTFYELQIILLVTSYFLRAEIRYLWIYETNFTSWIFVLRVASYELRV